MSTKQDPKEFCPGEQSRYRQLPLVGPVLDDLLSWFRRQRYAESTICNHVKALSRLILWLQSLRDSALSDLSQADLRLAYDHFRVRRYDVAAVARSLGRYLREQNLLPEGGAEVLSPTELQLEAFCSYLQEVRGLARGTIAAHQSRLRSFLEFLGYAENPSIIGTLDLGEIEAFLCAAAKTNNRFSLQHVVGTIRAFLRYQHAQGLLPHPLHEQIDTPRTYRLEQLPRALPWEQIVSLLRSIDQSESGAARDFTLLYLAARYGLRSSELVALTLDDFDWRLGTLRVRQSKTKQILLLPLTDEATDVLVRYLESARPSSEYRELFLRRKAPMGPLAHTAVHDILEKRIRLSGLDIPKIGTHVLRHSFAVHLLRRGTSVDAIGDLLGHRDSSSTAAYLRLAIEDLREVGLPVPGNGEAVALNPIGWKSKLPRARTTPPKKLLGKADFRSLLATSLRDYLEIRRALGRRYSGEEQILRNWDDFLHCRYAKARDIGSEMFHCWAETMPALRPTVRRNRLRIVRNFLIFHARNHPNTYIPDLATFPDPSPPRLPFLVSETEMARLLETARQLSPSHQNPVRGPTIRLALILLFCCGLRRGELLRLKLEHFDSHENVLRIESTKFHKSRLIPLSDSVAKELSCYVQLRRSQHLPAQPENALIWSKNPVARENVYSAPALADNWHQLCLAANVLDERGRPPRIHDLRHSFAVASLQRWYEAGERVQAKLPFLSTYMGHVCPSSTHYYLHLTSGLRNAASERFHQYANAIFEKGGAK